MSNNSANAGNRSKKLLAQTYLRLQMDNGEAPASGV